MKTKEAIYQAIQRALNQRKIKEDQHAAKAQVMWDSFTDQEKTLVRFGMFPADKMKAAEAETLEGECLHWDGRMLAVKLMDCAKRNGGMVM
jgi:hypothetical protein